MRLKDLLLLVGLGFSLLIYEPAWTAWLRPQTLYVSPDGSDWHWGGRPESPLATIQHAADVVPNGGTVVLLPGVYRERPRIRRGGSTKHKPLVFRAQTPGTAVISGQAPMDIGREMHWKEMGDGRYSCTPPWPIYWMRCDGESLFRCYAKDEFFSLTDRKASWGAFLFLDGKLFLATKDRRHPSHHHVEIHGPVHPQGLWHTFKAANAWVEADHIRFEGLCFDFGVGAGLRVWRASNVAVVECLFAGATEGVDACSRIKPAKNLSLSHCLYHNYPQGLWMEEWLEWQDVYASYSTNRLVCSVDGGTRIFGNLVLHGADGMYVSALSGNVTKGIDVANNLVAHCTDDAFELDGPAKNVSLHDNLVYNCFVSLGLSPVSQGPVKIADNFFLHPANGINGAQLKLMGSRSSDLENNPIQNIMISRNMFVGNWLAWYSHAVQEVMLEDNVFAFKHRKAPSWPAGTRERDNLYIRLPSSGYPNPGADPKWRRFLLGSGNDNLGSRQGITPPMGPRFHKTTRPGPRWLDWNSMTVTQSLEKQVSGFFGS